MRNVSNLDIIITYVILVKILKDYFKEHNEERKVVGWRLLAFSYICYIKINQRFVFKERW